MSLIKIIKDEALPVYGLSPASEAGRDPDVIYDLSPVVDVPDELIQRYEAAEAAYNAVQDELEALFNEHRRNRD